MSQFNYLLREIKIKDDFNQVKSIVPLQELYRTIFGQINELDLVEEKKGVFVAESSIDKLIFNTNSLKFKAVSFSPDIYAPEERDIQEWEREVDQKKMLELLKNWGFTI